MEQKKKLCQKCNSLQFIWKNLNGKKLCRKCSTAGVDMFKPTNKKPKPIAIRSPKKIHDDRVYAVERKQFLEIHKMCEAHLQGCTQQATDIHHTFWGADRSKYYLDTSTWKSVCRSCHSVIHDKLSSEEALLLNLKNFKNEN